MIKPLFLAALLLGVLLHPAKAVSEEDIVGAPPASAPDMIEYLEQDGGFKLLLAALKSANLTETLRGKEVFTLLAPTDDAFRRLPQQELELLMAPSGKQKLASLLCLHIIPQKISSGQLFHGHKIKTFQGQEIPLEILAGNYMFDQAKLLKPDVICSNGLIQVIDRVIQPLP